MPWQPEYLPITLRLSVNNCNLLSSLAASTDERDVRAGAGMDSMALGDVSWQFLQATDDGTALNLRPQAKDRVQQQSFNIGELGATSAHGRGWRTDYSSLAITFDDIGKQRRRTAANLGPKMMIEPDGSYSMLLKLERRTLNSEAGEWTILPRLSPPTITARNRGRNGSQASLSPTT